MANRFHGRMGHGARKIVQESKKVEAEERNEITVSARKRRYRMDPVYRRVVDARDLVAFLRGDGI